jgi:hypothetical protein
MPATPTKPITQTARKKRAARCRKERRGFAAAFLPFARPRAVGLSAFLVGTERRRPFEPEFETPSLEPLRAPRSAAARAFWTAGRIPARA